MTDLLKRAADKLRADAMHDYQTADTLMIRDLAQRIRELEAENERLRGLLRELIDGDHIYGNDSERVLVKIEAALGGL